jgi:hypothetical protein
VHDLDELGVHLGADAGLRGRGHVACVDGGAVLHAGAPSGAWLRIKRHRLTLHVRAHQRAVGVVVLEERDQRGCDRHHLARRHVHVVDVLGRDVVDLPSRRRTSTRSRRRCWSPFRAALAWAFV